MILGALFLATNPLCAQNPPAPAPKEALWPKEAFQEADGDAAWVEHFDGVTLQGWQPEGDVTIKDGALVVGGARGGKFRLKVPLGDRFKVLLECRYDGPSTPLIRFETRTFMSGGISVSSLHGPGAAWMDLLLVGQDHDGQFTLTEYYRTGDKGPASGGGYGGRGTASLSIEVPAGTTMTIRRLRVQTTPPAGLGGVFLALGGLAAALTLLAILGWWLRRRRPALLGPG